MKSVVVVFMTPWAGRVRKGERRRRRKGERTFTNSHPPNRVVLRSREAKKFLRRGKKRSATTGGG
jgi:hypothetical protein